MKRSVISWVSFGLVSLLLFAILSTANPFTGLTWLVKFGDYFEPRALPQLRKIKHSELFDSWGYDGQFYAQMAIRPDPHDASIVKAMDDSPYRFRRIFLSAFCHLLGCGNAAFTLHLYSLANIFFWLLAAVLLARWWIRLDDWLSLLRWSGVIFSAGALSSILCAMPDLPGLFLMMVGLYYLGSNRRLLGACFLALSGLSRETNLLGCVGVSGKKPGYAVLALLPPLLWFGYLLTVFGTFDGGLRNFDWPWNGVMGMFAWERTHGITGWRLAVPTFGAISLYAQAFHILGHPRWSSGLWRVGAAFAALFFFLGTSVWEGYPGAIYRVLLPMTFVFNVLVKDWKWAVAGNLHIILMFLFVRSDLNSALCTISG
jgi:hypothetical protein